LNDILPFLENPMGKAGMEISKKNGEISGEMYKKIK